MSTPILLTKFFIPATRPGLVSRPRLIEKLNHGLHSKLALVSAPAGFGKTTLVTNWLQSQEDDSLSPFLVGWLSLDEGDNDVFRFLTYLIAALNHLPNLEVTIGSGALQMIQSPQPPSTETVLTAVINDIALLSDKLVLVMDDYHLIDSQPVHETLNFLIENLPPQLHLVITTRVDPTIPLSRLRSRGQLTELRAVDLRFTLEETSQFLNQVMGLQLSAADIAALEIRTEGWIAGLQLAAISMQGTEDTAGFIQSFTGSNRLILDYLIEEVLTQQSKEIQTFLSQTSILNHLTGPLCDALTGQENGQANLEALERTNLFIVPLDNERRWYRYHHLFADLLHQRLHLDQPDLVLELHRRASEWYERNGFADDAMEHALSAADFERAAHLLEGQADALWMQGENVKLQGWLAKLPVDLVFSKPLLCIYHAWYHFASGDEDAAERSLQAFEQALAPNPDITTETSPLDHEDHLSDTVRTNLRGKAAAIRAFMASYRQDVSEIILHARQALEYLPEQDFPMRSFAAIALGDAYTFKGEMTAAYQARLEAIEVSRSTDNPFFLIATSVKLAMTLRTLGQLHRTVEVCQQTFQVAETSGLAQVELVGLLFAIWGEVLAELNDLDEALYRAQSGVDLTERGRDLAVIGWSYKCLMRVLFSRGEAAGAEEVVQKVEAIARDADVPRWFTNDLTAWQMRFFLAQDELEATSQWEKQRSLETDSGINPLHQFGFTSLVEFTVLARILIAQEQLGEATRLLARLLEAVETGELISGMIEILMLQALAYQATGDTEQAMGALQHALALADSRGFIRIFIDEGPSMARLLYEALSREIAPEYVRRLLGTFPTLESEESPKSQTQTGEFDWVEPLSERELEVLQLIAEGLTNDEIGDRLCLSPNTVKTHARNIYSKLGVKSRTQAVARARTMGLMKST
jgi:LuxR family maltose regulon positive regulatory protein